MAKQGMKEGQQPGVSPLHEPALGPAMEIDAILQGWRRRISKRMLGRHVLADLDVGLDLAALDALNAIEPPEEDGVGETTVSAVAERMSIDPSRASRLVAELVRAGYAERGVSQADARRTIVALTPAGRLIVEAVQNYKHLILGDFLAEWSEEELQAFLPLLQRFTEWSDSVGERRSRFTGQIAALAETIAKARKQAEQHAA